MSALRIWVMAARPRTLPAALAPVLVGSAAGRRTLAGRAFRWGAFVAALIGAIFIQIGTNLANDYSDAKRGADTVDRLGPVRVRPPAWPRRGGSSRDLGGVRDRGPRRPLPGLRGRPGDPRRSASLSIAAGVLYTGGPKPYGYEGLGEVFVFVFFGLVAVNGSYYVQLEESTRARAALYPGRPALGGDPGRQQRPRHRHGPPGRQADARRAARPRASRDALRGG